MSEEGKNRPTITSDMLQPPKPPSRIQKVENDSEERILREWNAKRSSSFDLEDSKLVFGSFDELYRWLKSRAKWHGGKGKVDYYKRIDVAAGEMDSVKGVQYLEDVKRLSRDVWTEVFHFYERAKSLKTHKVLQSR